MDVGVRFGGVLVEVGWMVFMVVKGIIEGSG